MQNERWLSYWSLSLENWVQGRAKPNAQVALLINLVNHNPTWPKDSPASKLTSRVSFITQSDQWIYLRCAAGGKVARE